MWSSGFWSLEVCVCVSVDSTPVVWTSMPAKLLLGLLSVVVKAVYMQMMLQCLLVWIAFVRYRLAEPEKNITEKR